MDKSSEDDNTVIIIKQKEIKVIKGIDLKLQIYDLIQYLI